MKTITEYQPLIYATLFAESGRRRSRKRQTVRWVGLGLMAGYFLAILGIMAQTGLTPWDWQFWAIFAPLLALGEKVLHAISRNGRARA